MAKVRQGRLWQVSGRSTLIVEGEVVRLTICQSVVTQVVTWSISVVQEKRSNLSLRILLLLRIGNLKGLESNGHANEDGTHRCSRDHEHPSSAEAGDDQGEEGRIEQAPAVVGEIELCLDEGLSETHHVEKETRVETEKGVTGHLGEETEESGDESTTTHTWGCKHYIVLASVCFHSCFYFTYNPSKMTC